MTPDDFRYLRQLVEKLSGICIEDGREYLFEARLAAVARDNGFATLSQLVEHLRATNAPGGVHRAAVEALATQETSFFRDGHPYEALRKVVLPELIARRAATRRLHLWSAAASTGQEPFSLAILLREHFPQLVNWEVKIIATDLSETALARARAGSFNRAEAARGLTASLLAKYFHADEDGVRARDEIRRAVEFRVFNLIGSWAELPQFDLILLRNVLIYFGPGMKRSVLEKTRAQLKPDGYLMLGAAETTLHLDGTYEVMHLEKSSFYRHAKRRGV